MRNPSYAVQGISLFELLITLCILSILSFFVVPSFSAFISSYQVSIARENIISAIQYSRLVAVQKNRRIVMLNNNGDWDSGWRIFIDEDGDAQMDPDEIEIATQGELQNIEIISNTPVESYISFVGTGESRLASQQSKGGLQMGSLSICHASQKLEGFKLFLSKVGRLRSKKLSVTECNNIKSATP